MQITKKIEIKISFNFEETPLISKFLIALYEVSPQKISYDNFVSLTIDELANIFIESINYKKAVINIDELNNFFANFNHSLETFLISGFLFIDNKKRFVPGIEYYIELPNSKRELSIEFTNINEFRKCIRGTCELNNVKLNGHFNELSLLKNAKFKIMEYVIIFDKETGYFNVKNLNIKTNKMQSQYFIEPTNVERTIKPLIDNSKIGDIKEFSIYNEKELADFELIEKLKNQGWVIISKKHKENMIIFTVRKEH